MEPPVSSFDSSFGKMNGSDASLCEELFSLCLSLAAQPPSSQANYRMHELLAQACSRGMRYYKHGGAFGNVFSQIDWLCRQCGIKANDRLAIQTARRHSNSRDVLSQEQWHHDLWAVALFISAVFQQAVPAALLALCPALSPQSSALSPHYSYIRCIVHRYDQQTIVAETDNGEVTIDYGNTDHGRDFAYLYKILREGMLLNLLNCQKEKDVIVPDLIVIEPDFLLDISSVAACFTNYGHHPLIYTVNRLKPRPNTQATLLGNFAGTALDCLICHGTSDVMDVALRRSFHEQGLRILACPDFDLDSFKTEATNQIENIRDALSCLTSPSLSLSSTSSPLPPSFITEPSFVCERLGLQGRVDLMTTDMRLLVEQKSGKNKKIEYQSHDSHGMQLESHYVQLLLYYGILHYNFGRSDQQTDIRLLYSRYPAAQGLLTVNNYRTLFREAICLRNQLVATDLFIAREGFARILPLLRADIIYKDIATDAFFHQYILPQFTSLDALYSSLSPLERAYYEQMMTFVYREQVCRKLGCSETRLYHSGGCASDLWLMPYNEKKASGNIIDHLTITQRQRSDEDGGYDIITLQYEPSAAFRPLGGTEGMRVVPLPLGGIEGGSPSNFRNGDMVYFYRYHADNNPDVRHAILYKGTLQDIGVDDLVVRLTNGQQNSEVFSPTHGETLWAIEHADSDISTNSQIRSLHQMMSSATQQRRDLLLGQRVPQADTTITLRRSYHPDYDDILLRIAQSRDYFLLIGPPGTGKTSMALRFIVEETLCSPSLSHILLTAYTNRAVDEICAMLTDAGIGYQRMGSDEFKAEELELTPIIVATTSMLLSQPYILEVIHFNLCVADEASQILEPGIVGLLSSPAIDRFVLIGDHKQLPAVVQQDADQGVVNSPLLKAIGLTDCRQSLFERLLRWERHEHRTQFIGVLHHQGRMHPDVALFPATHFYAEEQLDIARRPHQLETTLGYTIPAEDHLDTLLQTRRMLFLSYKDYLPFGGTEGGAEAFFVADLLRRIYRFTADHFDPHRTVGVIVPYRSQIALIRQALVQLEVCGELLDISIDTVERYQGSQRDIIIYSFAVSHLYQLDFLSASTVTDTQGRLIDRKLNVALTRARCQTIITGNPDILRHNPLFRQLIEDYQE